MKKLSVCLALAALLLSSVGCSNWNRMTPKRMDNTAIEEEVRKNLAVDRITGLHIDVTNGVVTLEGHVKNSSDRQKAYDDAAKVNGVKQVVNRLAIE